MGVGHTVNLSLALKIQQRRTDECSNGYVKQVRQEDGDKYTTMAHLIHMCHNLLHSEIRWKYADKEAP